MRFNKKDLPVRYLHPGRPPPRHGHDSEKVILLVRQKKNSTGHFRSACRRRRGAHMPTTDMILRGPSISANIARACSASSNLGLLPSVSKVRVMKGIARPCSPSAQSAPSANGLCERPPPVSSLPISSRSPNTNKQTRRLTNQLVRSDLSLIGSSTPILERGRFDLKPRHQQQIGRFFGSLSFFFASGLPKPSVNRNSRHQSQSLAHQRVSLPTCAGAVPKDLPQLAATGPCFN
jgi:hypothetical protein